MAEQLGESGMSTADVHIGQKGGEEEDEEVGWREVERGGGVKDDRGWRKAEGEGKATNGGIQEFGERIYSTFALTQPWCLSLHPHPSPSLPPTLSPPCYPPPPPPLSLSLLPHLPKC